MSRGILVVGNESPLFSAVCAQAEKTVEQYAAALIPGFGSPAAENAAVHSEEEPETEKGRNLLSWNPSSPLSARTLILGAENRLEQMNEAILVCSPQAVYRSACELSHAEIDKYINDQIKGWFFLVRELSLVFKAREGGTLSLVVPDSSAGAEKGAAGKDAPSDLLGPAAAVSFRALAQGLLISPDSASFSIMGFTGNPPSDAEFAAWIFKIINEGNPRNSRRWHKYSKFSLFK